VTDLPAVVLALVGTGVLFALAILAAWHVWYALALSRVFVAHDTEPWRAWVPVLNEAELLRLGREDPVKAALFLVPVVNLYAIVLKAIAAARIGRAQDRSGALVALAVVLPPLWATLLAAPRGPRTTATSAPVAAPVPGVAAGVRPTDPIAPTPPLPPAPGPGAGADASAPAPAAPPAPPAPAPAASSAPSPGTPADAVPAGPPLTRRAAALRRDGVDDATAIVRAPAGWELVLPAGDTVALTSRVVILGRNPQAEDDAQVVPVADTTRTVSKRHARLEWDGRTWTLTDLDSTNGVSVTVEGSPRMLPPGTPVPVPDGFALGDAAVVLRRSA